MEFAIYLALAFFLGAFFGACVLAFFIGTRQEPRICYFSGSEDKHAERLKQAGENVNAWRKRHGAELEREGPFDHDPMDRPGAIDMF